MNTIEELIEKGTQTPTGKKLYDVLTKISSQRSWLAYNLNLNDTDERRQKLMDYIERYGITDSDDVRQITEYLEDGIEPEFEER